MKKIKEKGLENHNPIQQIIRSIKETITAGVDIFFRKFGTCGRVWYFFGVQSFFSDCMPSWIRPTWDLSRFRFIPETVFKFYWLKTINVQSSTGHEIKDQWISKYKREEYNRTTEHRSWKIYNPFVIHSFYNAIANDRKIVVEDDEIETHSFRWCVQRKRMIWNNYYQITVHQDDDETVFDRALDSYLSGDQ